MIAKVHSWNRGAVMTKWSICIVQSQQILVKEKVSEALLSVTCSNTVYRPSFYFPLKASTCKPHSTELQTGRKVWFYTTVNTSDDV